MGTCKYCGLKASLFSKAHKECEQKHSAGMLALKKRMDSYFQTPANASSFQAESQRIIADCFLSSQDVEKCAQESIDAYTDRIHRPYSPGMMQIVSQFVSLNALSYSAVDRNGSVTRFAQKLVKGHIADYFTGVIDINQMNNRIAKVASVLPLSTVATRETYLYMLNKAATNFLSDGLITPQEQNLLDNYTNTCGIQTNNLPAPYQNSDITKIAQAKILSNLQNGVMPPQPIQLPILLTKGESLIWTYDNVTLYQEKIQKEYVGGSHGMSTRICKGVYYRTGQFKGHTVEHSYMDNLGIGSLYLTNKNLIFSAPTKAVKIPYSKLIGLTPYSDGIEILKDGATKRMVMQGFDSWFIMNLLSLISHL